MVQLRVNTPVITRTDVLEVDGMRAGTYRFALCAIDDQGNKSLPDIATVRVTFREIITPVRPVRPIVPIVPVRPISR